MSTHRNHTLARWAADLQRNFAARMDWCIADSFDKANHAPSGVLNQDTTKRIMHISAMPGETVKLSAEGSKDPDGNSFHTTWFIYREPGHCPADAKILTTHGMETTLVISQVETPQQIRIILQLQDTGNPPLMAYRRAVVEVNSRKK